jgi:hypothetical protein
MARPQTLSFVITVPTQTIEDLALNMNGVDSIEGANMGDLAALLQEALAAGLEDYLGEVDNINIRPA